MHDSSPKLPKVLFACVLLFGVLLPLAALVFEMITSANKHSFFNPIPSPFHVLMICTVPLANALCAFAIARRSAAISRRLAWLNAFAIGVALVYAIMFLPMLPIAPLAIIFFGIGLLPMAPLLSLLAALGVRRRLQIWGRDSALPSWPPLWAGILLAVSAFLIIDLPATLTHVGLRMATAEAPSTQLAGLRWLRAIGNESLMLRLCYARSGVSTDMLGLLMDIQSPLSPDMARRVFYQTTGKAFNDLPAPVRNRPRDWDSLFDAEQGGEVVGGKASGVSMTASRIDGLADANAALSYLEWTMVFHNVSATAQEARAEIALPADAVVSRLTLWIDGEEREAAFGSRAQVRQAYEKVVKARRDPVLVTTAGKDRVLVQLFPIPPGGDMKVRIGMTAPMSLPDPRNARLQLPKFSERNFDMAPSLQHAVWIESRSEWTENPGMYRDTGKGLPFALRGDAPAIGDTTGRMQTIGARRDPVLRTAWGEDTRSGQESVVQQTIAVRPVRMPRRVAIVIDGSASMKPFQEHLAKVLSQLPSKVEVALVLAGDGAPELLLLDGPGHVDINAYVNDFSFIGGRDNIPALIAAWDWAASGEGGEVLWVHGPQPTLLNPIDPLVQRLQRRPGRVNMTQLEAVTGHDEISKQLDGVVAIERIARDGTVGEDLFTYASQWRANATRMHVERKRSDSRGVRLEKTSDHLVRLWAAGQVAALIARQNAQDREQATALAVRYQLVTPVSGAVVLETPADYKAAGLEPVPPGSVPTLPEPETWAMLAIALLLLGWRFRNRHRYQPKDVVQ